MQRASQTDTQIDTQIDRKNGSLLKASKQSLVALKIQNEHNSSLIQSLPEYKELERFS
jgi:hypothetical protein